MLESFRRRDASRPLNARPESPYSQLHQALSPAPPTEAPKPEPAKAEAPKVQESPKAAPAGDKIVCKLTVGPEIKLKGAEITDCDTLVVEGRVEASMNSRVIQIAENGVFVGKVGIDVAEIRGRFEGELTAHKQLLIHATGRVSGTIRYGSVSIEQGGELTGDIGTITAAKAFATGIGADPGRAQATASAASANALAGGLRSGAGR